jgi:RNA polymerase sigma factor (sigma-70 family)
VHPTSRPLPRIETVMSDDDRLSTLLRRSAPLVHRLERRFGGRQQAEDAVQEALIRAWQLQATGDRVTSWDAWVATTAANAVRMELRRRDAERRALDRLAAGGPRHTYGGWEDPWQDGLGTSLAAGDLGDAVRALPARERQVLVLHHVADLPVAEVADRLGVSTGTVKRALHDARRRLATAVAPPSSRPGGTAPPTGPASTRRNPVHGWIMAGSHPAEYAFDVDRSGTAAVGVLRSVVAEAGGFGTIMQIIRADNYTGKRVRLSGDAAVTGVDGWFGFWLRVDGDRQGQPLAFDNMESRALKGTQGWGRYEVVLDVAPEATAIAFGALLVGTGAGRLRGLRFEEVAADVPPTGRYPGPMPDEPVNLDFAVA